jgi:hypothetical protein
MGIRGELFSNRVILPNRTYFFNVKENRMGDLYLNIVESKNRETSGFDRQSVVLFADDLQEFLKGFDESLRVLEKAVREKRRSSPGEGARRGERPERGERYDRGDTSPRGGRYGRDEKYGRGEKPERGEKYPPRPSSERPKKFRREEGREESRRVVVKKYKR